jgi:uncharacterized protein
MRKNSTLYLDDNAILIYEDISRKCFLFSQKARVLFELPKSSFNYLKKRQGVKLSKIDSKLGTKLVQLGILAVKQRHFLEAYAPTKATFFLTNNCNLRCKYCYANAGEIDNKVLDFNLAKNVVDYIIENASKGKKNIILNFHGGGEPFVAFDRFKEILEYAKRKSVEKGIFIKKVTASTNGVLTDEAREWVVKNLTNIQISIDGLKKVQEYQRPVFNGKKSSFEEVIKTMRYFDDNLFEYRIKSTLTSKSVCGILGFVKFICKNTKCRKIHFETLNYFGRGCDGKILPPSFKKLVACWAKAQDYADKNGVKFYSSELNINYSKSDFCAATTNNLIITPEGILTMCYKVSSPVAPLADKFIIGKSANGLELDFGKINYLRLIDYKPKGCMFCAAFSVCNNKCLASYMLGNKLDRKKKNKIECGLRVNAVKKQIYNFYKNPDLRKFNSITFESF